MAGGGISRRTICSFVLVGFLGGLAGCSETAIDERVETLSEIAIGINEGDGVRVQVEADGAATVVELRDPSDDFVLSEATTDSTEFSFIAEETGNYELRIEPADEALVQVHLDQDPLTRFLYH